MSAFRCRVAGTYEDGPYPRDFDDAYEIDAESADEALLALLRSDFRKWTIDARRPFSIKIDPPGVSGAD